MNTPHASSPFSSLKINHAAIRVPDFWEICDMGTGGTDG